MSESLEHDFNPQLTWNSSKDDIINDFYRPGLVNCKLYQRLSGYFSSTTFSNVANEILDFIQSDGKIQLITSPQLSSKDKEILEHSVTDKETILKDNFLEELRNEPDSIKMEFFKLVGYMLANTIDGKPQLEIKIAIPKSGGGIFHQKIGIFHYNNGEKIAFAGSVNETWKGWAENIENLTVFCSWMSNDTNNQGIMDNQRNFNDLWSNNDEKIQIFDLPSAVKQRLLEIRPRSEEELQSTIEKIKRIIPKHDTDDLSQMISTDSIQLREHQHDAINKWIENDSRGLLEMATGTGKTFTAFGCISQIQKSHNRTVTVIACPLKHLVEQWKNTIDAWNKGVGESNKIALESKIICHSDYTGWKEKIQKETSNFQRPLLASKTYPKNHMVIFTTHATLTKSLFTEKITGIKNVKKTLIVDEVHNITAEASLKTLLEEFDFRLGLSATPTRHMDEKGTSILKDYFHGIVYTLDLKKAIDAKILCPYKYFPSYVELTPNEMDEYKNLTAKIAQIEEKKKRGIKIDLDKFNPYLRRADVVANAENKDQKLIELLDFEFNNKLDHTLIYCTNNLPISDNPKKQLERVQEILVNKGITSDSVTWEDKTRERLDILDNLKTGHLDCVTAIKCLDEGVDVPHVHTGIFMASSGNPKQFIQRRGRILRKNDATSKDIAYIYDILVTPPNIQLEDVEYSLLQRKLIAKELLRHKEFAQISVNQNEAIQSIKEIAKIFAIDLDALSYDYISNMV